MSAALGDNQYIFVCGLEGGQRVRRRRQGLARRKRSVTAAPRRATHRDRQPAGVSIERDRAEFIAAVQHSREQTIRNTHARHSLRNAFLRTGAHIIPQTELKIARAGVRAAAALELTLIRESGSQIRLRAQRRFLRVRACVE